MANCRACKGSASFRLAVHNSVGTSSQLGMSFECVYFCSRLPLRLSPLQISRMLSQHFTAKVLWRDSFEP